MLGDRLFYWVTKFMHTARAMVIVIFIVCVTMISNAKCVAAEQSAIRVMLLGNSITQGYTDSYRRPLWLALQEAGMNIDFVGTMSQGYAGQEQYSDYDSDHEGHWGWFSDEVLARIDDWATNSDPDIVLIHLGTNDIGSGQDIAQTGAEIERIIERLRVHNPRVHVLLATIIPVAHTATTKRIGDFNERLSALVMDLDSTRSRVVLVDQFAGFDANQDTYDGIHPNERGNQKMAAKWFAGLNLLLSGQP